MTSSTSLSHENLKNLKLALADVGAVAEVAGMGTVTAMLMKVLPVEQLKRKSNLRHIIFSTRH